MVGPCTPGLEGGTKAPIIFSVRADRIKRPVRLKFGCGRGIRSFQMGDDHQHPEGKYPRHSAYETVDLPLVYPAVL